jgi:hypothetical protein
MREARAVAQTPHDWDHSNNASDNVILLCDRCHVVAHQCGYVSAEEFLRVRKLVRERDPERFKDDDDDLPKQLSLWS